MTGECCIIFPPMCSTHKSFDGANLSFVPSPSQVTFLSSEICCVNQGLNVVLNSRVGVCILQVPLCIF